METSLVCLHFRATSCEVWNNMSLPGLIHFFHIMSIFIQKICFPILPRQNLLPQFLFLLYHPPNTFTNSSLLIHLNHLDHLAFVADIDKHNVWLSNTVRHNRPWAFSFLLPSSPCWEMWSSGSLSFKPIGFSTEEWSCLLERNKRERREKELSTSRVILSWVPVPTCVVTCQLDRKEVKDVLIEQTSLTKAECGAFDAKH